MTYQDQPDIVSQGAMSSKKRSAWITWEIQVRNRSMAKVLEVPLYEMVSTQPRFIRYAQLTIRTIVLIIKNKLDILYVQNPSIVLSFIAVFLKPILRLTVIVDAHNGGIYPLEGKSQILNFFARLICRKADYVIVTNSYLAQTVKDWGGRPFVMPDPIPDFSQHPEKKISAAKPYILFICTWADDEPYHEVIKAAEDLEQIDIYVTGNFKKRLSVEQIQNLPPSVKLLGFVAEDDYINYFRNAAGAIDLTTRDNCLVCGGYEAVAFGVPIILSKFKVNEEVFFQGCVFAENHAKPINAAITFLLSRREELALDIHLLKVSHQRSTLIKKSQLLELTK